MKLSAPFSPKNDLMIPAVASSWALVLVSLAYSDWSSDHGLVMLARRTFPWTVPDAEDDKSISPFVCYCNCSFWQHVGGPQMSSNERLFEREVKIV